MLILPAKCPQVRAYESGKLVSAPNMSELMEGTLEATLDAWIWSCSNMHSPVTLFRIGRNYSGLG